MNAPQPLAPSAIAALLEAQATTILKEIQALPAEVCTWQPAAGEWSINDVLGHLLEAERRGFNGRIRTLLEQDTPSLPGWDQEVVAAERRDRGRDTAALLSEFTDLRTDSIALVRGLQPDQLGRSGTHELVGTIGVNDLLHEWVHHDRNHVKQLLSVVQSYVRPSMGNCRRFEELE